MAEKIKKDIVKEDPISTQSEQISDVAKEGVEAMRPDYADAMRNLKKTAKIRKDIVDTNIENAKKKDGPVETKIKGTPAQKKMYLSESLFETLREDYGWSVKRGEEFELLHDLIDAFGAEEVLLNLAQALGTDELSENLAYLCRMFDFSSRHLGGESDDEEEYDRRAVEREYDLEDGELDGVSIRDAEELVGEEEGALDRFIIEEESLKGNLHNIVEQEDVPKAHNKALKLAKEIKKPVAYGYLSNKSKKFVGIDPIEHDGDDDGFRSKYKDAETIYVAYPDKDFLK